MNTNQDRLLIIDDDQGVRKFLASASRRLKYDVATASDRETVIRKLDSFDPSTILLDLQMPGEDGIQILKLLKEKHTDSRVVLMSGLDTRTLETATSIGQILGLNMAGSLSKPILISDLRRKLRKARSDASSIDAVQIEQAIDRGEFLPSYQPKVVCDTNQHWSISEVEVLARWHRPDAEIVLPGAFIEIAEEAGLLPKLTDSLIRQSVRQLRDWDDRGLKLGASVNLSPSLLNNSTFPEELERITREHGIDNERLTLELTESAITQNASLAMEILSRLRIKGFGLSIDDFGTGYSSLEQLYRMPFNELKIDRFLVRDIGTRREAATIVEAIIMLAHKLEISVCAEGVEERETVRFLLDAGCDKMQGYYFGRPSSARIMEKRVCEFQDSVFTYSADPYRESESRCDTPQRPLPILCT